MPALAPMVGRELDLAVSLEQLKRIERPAAASLLVRGDAGIGKSRLVAELAGRARQHGHLVLMGRADDLDHGIPYAIFRDVFARPIGDPAASDDVPELVEAFRTALAEGDPGDGTDHVAIVFGALERVLRALAEHGSVVVILEDLHVADRASLAIVGPLARLADLPLLTVVTLRPDSSADDVERFFERMAADGRGAVVDLEPLDRHETQALIANVLGAVPDDAVSDAVFNASHGNPFFAAEAVQSYAEGGAVMLEGGKARLVVDAPALGLRPNTALLRRVFSGTSGDVELAKVMSVFGRFSLRQLSLVARLTGQPEAEVARSFDRLVKSGLLVESAGGFEFSHAIVRSTLYDDIGPAERRRIHGAIAEQLADDRKAGLIDDVLELATHVAASAEPGDEDAARVLLDAGRAVAVTAPLVSADYHRRAAELLPVGSPLRVEALALQTRALHVSSRPTEVASVGLSALGELPPGPLRSATASLVAHNLFLAARPDEALRVLDAELEHGTERCTALASYVNTSFQAGRFDDAAKQFQPALDALDGPAAIQLLAITNLVQYASHTGEAAIAADLLARAERLGEGAGERSSPTIQHAVHGLEAFADWRPGLMDRLDRHLANAKAVRPDTTVLSIGAGLEAAQARLDWMQGRWDQVLEVTRSVGFDLEAWGHVVTFGLFSCTAAEIAIDRGNLDDATASLERCGDEVLALQRYRAFVHARLSRALGDVDRALQLLHDERAAAEGGSLWKLAEILRELVELYLEAGRDDDARAATEELEQLATRTGWLEGELAALRARALIDHDADVASAYLDRATQERWDVEQAHASLLLGELDVDPTTHLTNAYRLFDSFGAAPARRRAAAALRARNLTVPRRAAREGTTLTDTEVQLVRLVYDGLSNQQIATAMHYSRKTIEVYLSRVYVKSGCASRLELIRAVERGDLDVTA